MTEHVAYYKQHIPLHHVVGDIRDPSRCGVIVGHTQCGFRVNWLAGKKTGPKWITKGYARKLIYCASTKGNHFYLTEVQIDAALKQLP